MADLLVFDADPQSPYSFGPSQWDWFGIQRTGPVNQLFASYVASAPPREGWFTHAATQQVFHATNGNLEHVAGQEDRTGNDDGPGATAKLGMAGLNAGGGAPGPNGEFYLPCQAYDCIKKITRNPNLVETFLTGIYTNTVACTGTTLLVVNGNTVQEYSLATKALIGSYPLPTLNIDTWLGGYIVAGGFWVYGWEQPGSATVVWRMDLTTHQVVHRMGRRASAGSGPPEDGPVLSAWLYKCSPVWFSPDGQQWRLTGGDSYFEILVDLTADQTTTRLNDGTAEPLPTRQGIAATILVGGVDEATGLPISYNYPWPPYPKGLPTARFFNKPRIIQGGGGQVVNAQFVSQTIDYPNYEVVMRNNGDVPWSEPIRLGAQNPPDNEHFAQFGRVFINGTVQPGEEYKFRFSHPLTAPQNFQWRMVNDGGPPGWFGPLTPNVLVTPNGGGMTKTLSWQTQMQNIPGGDHYKVTINGTAQPPVPYDATEVVLEVSPGDVIEAQTADAADNWLAAPQSVTVPGEPGSKIIISLQLS